MPENSQIPATRARHFLRGLRNGILATMSLELPGYPFGSLTPFGMTAEGEPTIYVSDIAQHTKNMLADPKVSLTVLAEKSSHNRQAHGRITILADARPLAADESEAALPDYLRKFPEARSYAGAHGFRLFKLEAQRLRFIGGFGDIFWVERDEWLVPTPSWRGSEEGVIDHMNADHRDALALIVKHQLSVDAPEVTLTAVDPDGFIVTTEVGQSWLPFSKLALTKDDLRQEFIDLSKEARKAL